MWWVIGILGGLFIICNMPDSLPDSEKQLHSDSMKKSVVEDLVKQVKSLEEKVEELSNKVDEISTPKRNKNKKL